MTVTPDWKALCDRARYHWRQGELEQAGRLYAQVLTADASNPVALEGMGLVILNRGDSAGAQQAFEQVLAIAPDRLSAQASLAELYKDAGRYAEARDLVERVLARKPDLDDVRFLYGEILWALGENEAAFRAFAGPCSRSEVHAGHLETLIFERLNEADWRSYATEKTFLQTRVRAGRSVWQAILPMLMLEQVDDLAQAARTYARGFPAVKPAMIPPMPYAHGKIRVGYLSPDLYDHPVGHLMAALLERHDKADFEITVFSHGPDVRDEVRERIEAAAGTFVDLTGLDDVGAAMAIRSREIDIAVTLSGYTLNARPGILAHRPAPAQVNFLGYAGSMGAPYIDYLIADRRVIPETEADRYAENIVWMPESYLPTDDRAVLAAAPTRAEEGLPEDGFVYMAHGPLCRISPMIFDTWMRILSRVKGSVLWLGEGAETSRANLRTRAKERGIDPDRLIFASRRAQRADHLARQALANLYLDTLPYNAHSTAADALWAGLPVLTCRGGTFPGRVAADLLACAGLSGLVTEGLADYQELAVALASDAQWQATIRKRVEAARATPLFNTARYAAHLEDAYRAMWSASRANRPPAPIVVEARP